MARYMKEKRKMNEEIEWSLKDVKFNLKDGTKMLEEIMTYLDTQLDALEASIDDALFPEIEDHFEDYEDGKLTLEDFFSEVKTSVESEIGSWIEEVRESIN